MARRVAKFGYKTDKTIHRDCILLDKAIYGTVQAARQWFKKLCKSLEEVGLTQSKVDPCVFYLKQNEALILLCCCTHIDDIPVIGEQHEVDIFKANLRGCFINIKELGPLTKHLGVWYK